MKDDCPCGLAGACVCAPAAGAMATAAAATVATDAADARATRWMNDIPRYPFPLNARAPRWVSGHDARAGKKAHHAAARASRQVVAAPSSSAGSARAHHAASPLASTWPVGTMRLTPRSARRTPCHGNGAQRVQVAAKIVSANLQIVIIRAIHAAAIAAPGWG